MMQFLCPRCGKFFTGVDRAGEVNCPRCKLTFIPDTLDDTTDLPAAHGPKQEFPDEATRPHFEMVVDPEGSEESDGPPDIDETQHLRYRPSTTRKEAAPATDAGSDATPQPGPASGGPTGKTPSSGDPSPRTARFPSVT